MTTVAAPPRLGPVALYALLAGPLLSMIDSSVINVAAADIAAETGHGARDVQWVATSYLLCLGVGLCVTPWLVRRFGTYRPYRWAVALFGLTSAACALAPGLWSLVAARGLQGLVAAPLVPLAMGLLLGNSEERRQVPAVAGIVLFAAPALGPSLGGLLIQLGGWPLIFWINVPLAILAVLAVRVLPPEWDAAPAAAPLDLLGLVLLAPGLVALLLAAETGPRSGWLAPVTVGWAAAGIALIAAFLVRSRRAAHPLLDLAPFAHPQAWLALVLSTLATVAAYAAVFLVPLFAQQVQGHGAFAVGLALLPAGVLTGLGTVLGERLAAATSARTTVVLGFAALAVSTAALAWADRGTPLWLLGLVLTGRAVAVGLITTPVLVELTARVPPELTADVNTAFNMVMRVAASIGIAALVSAYAQHADPVAGLRVVAWVMVAIAVVGMLLAGRVSARPEHDPR